MKLRIIFCLMLATVWGHWQPNSRCQDCRRREWRVVSSSGCFSPDEPLYSVFRSTSSWTHVVRHREVSKVRIGLGSS